MKIIFHCVNCGSRIETFIDDEGELNGMFIGVDSVFSEMLDKFVSVKVKCAECSFTKDKV
jgi:hypothetical protein